MAQPGLSGHAGYPSPAWAAESVAWAHSRGAGAHLPAGAGGGAGPWAATAGVTMDAHVAILGLSTFQFR